MANPKERARLFGAPARGTEIAGSVSTMEIGVPQLSCKGTFEVKTLSLNKWIPEEARGARFDVST